MTSIERKEGSSGAQERVASSDAEIGRFTQSDAPPAPPLGGAWWRVMSLMP